MKKKIKQEEHDNPCALIIEKWCTDFEWFWKRKDSRGWSTKVNHFYYCLSMYPSK